MEPSLSSLKITRLKPTPNDWRFQIEGLCL
jgi:hypothetical protein